jgi:replicative DNA helicase
MPFEDQSNVREAEQALLGACIQNKEVYYRVISRLKADDFEGPNRVLFEDLSELRNQTGDANAETFLAYLRSKKDLGKIGGESYYIETISNAPLPDEIDGNIDIIKDNADARHFFDKIHQIENDFNNKPVEDISEFLGQAEHDILEVTKDRRISDFRDTRSVFKSMKEQFANDLKFRQEQNITDPYITGYPTGYEDVDKLTGGFHPSDLIILAARPSVGKTALALNFAHRIAKSGKPVAIFSLEMSAEQILLRLLSNESGVPSNRIKSIDLDNFRTSGGEDERKIAAAVQTLQSEPLFIDDTSSQTMQDIYAKARKLKAQHPDLALIVIDYLGLIVSKNHNSNVSRQQEVSDITRNLKAMARDLSVPALVLAQLSRAVEGRQSHVPGLSDLRDSGSIEQDADMVFFIYRPDYQAQMNEKNNDKAGSYQAPQTSEQPKDNNVSDTTVYLAKNRNGPIGKVQFLFYKDTCRFEAQVGEGSFGEDPGSFGPDE